MQARSIFTIAQCIAFVSFSVTFSLPAMANDRPARITVILPYTLSPFVMRDPDGHPRGARVDAWALWSAQTGVAVDLVPQSMAMSQKPIDIPKNTVLDLYLQNLSADSGLATSKPYTTLDLTLFQDTKTDATTATSVGTVANSSCDRYLTAKGYRRINRYYTATDLVAAATSGRLSQFCMAKDTQAQFAQGIPLLGRFEPVGEDIAAPVGWAVPRDQTALFNLVEAGFATIPINELRAIEENWRANNGLKNPTRDPKNLLTALISLLIGTLAVTIFFLLKLKKERAFKARAQHILQDSLRRRTCLDRIVQVTENMARPLPDILADIGAELHQVWPVERKVSTRITLLGVTHEQPGLDHMVESVAVNILINGVQQGQITLKTKVPRTGTPGMAFSDDDIRLLKLIAAQISSRASANDSLIHLRSSAERFFLALMTSDRPTAILSNHCFTHVNAAAVAMLGFSNASDLIGRSPADFSPQAQPDGQTSAEKLAALFCTTVGRGNLAFEWTHLKADGTPVVTEVLMTALLEKESADFFVIWTDITERRRTETELANYRHELEHRVNERTAQIQALYDRLNTILTTADSGIVLVRHGKVARFNPALARLFRWPADELEGAATKAIFHEASIQTTLLTDAFQAFSKGLTFETKQECLRRDGSSFWARMRARAVDPNDPEAGAVWVVDDITQERAATEKLAQGRDLAVQATVLKSRFLAEMSHEIRAPVNAVLGFTDMLMHTEMSTPQLDYMQKVQSAGHHLLGIVNNVLDLSKVESGHLQLEETKFDLAPILRCAVDAILPQTAARDVEIIVKADPQLPKSFIGDPLRITQILMNYLTNAQKFTPTGEICLTVENEGIAAGRMQLKFSVSDTGIGMSPDQANRIFDAFTQADAATARLYGGSGLCLSICHQLAQLMGGEVDVESIQGKGSTFWFRIALHPLAGASVIPETWQNLRGSRVLIADDNATAARFLRDRLHSLGVQVITVSSGRDAITATLNAKADGQPFDAVLIDRKMPIINGIETVRALRKNEPRDQMALVLMTKNGGTDLTDIKETVGIDEILTKPVDVSVLAEKLSNLLQHRYPTPQRAQPAHLPPSASQVWTGRRALVVDDGALSLEITAAILTRQGFAVQTATSGEEALSYIMDQHFDVVLMDFKMPDMDGIETTRRICATAAMFGIVPPIIGLSGRVQDSERKAGLEAGMIDYICKPVTAAALSTVLARVVTPDAALSIH